MPKLPVVKDREIIKVLLRVGFFEHSERGTSHLIFSHPNGRRITVSRHSGKDVPRGTFRAILRDIGISPKEFTSILKK